MSTTETAALCTQALKHYGEGQLAEAQSLYQQALLIEPENAEIYNMLGMIALQLGQTAVAEEFFCTAITFAPKIGRYHRNLGSAYYAQEKKKHAEKSFRRATELDPEDTTAYLNLGLLRKYDQRYIEALEYFKKAIMTKTNIAQPLTEYADTLIHLQRYDEAHEAATAAVKLTPDSPLALASLGTVLRLKNSPTESVAWLRQADSLAPNNPQILLSLAKSYIDTGESRNAYEIGMKVHQQDPANVDALVVLASAAQREQSWSDAVELIEKALDIKPGDRHLISKKASLLNLAGKPKQAMELIEPLIRGQRSVDSDTLMLYIELATKLHRQTDLEPLIKLALQDKSVPPAVRMSLSFSAGKYFDATGQHKKAFRYYASGNRSKDREYDKRNAERRVRAEIESFPATLLQTLYEKAEKNHPGEPIFIVGMPRSGTSLTERILGSHPEVDTGGESPAMKKTVLSLQAILESDKGYPFWANKLSHSVLTQAAEDYLQHLHGKLGEVKRYVTDKMPQNFHYLGLISLMFPNAPIIHCKRDPLDTCLSNYFQNFAGAGLEFTYNLDDLGHYYRLYEKIMGHWYRALPSPIYELEYERLVTEPEEEIRRLIDFCGLEWNEACLNHHKSNQITQTASYDQTTQPIYTKSKQRWRHYEKELQPLMESLEKYREILS